MSDSDVEEEELYLSWALLILTTLLIGALWTSYYLQIRRIRAVHETVVSIFAGMFVGLIIRVSPGIIIQNMVTFNHAYFFNLLLPPIILNSGYELKRSNFFRNFGTILTFAFFGTIISSLVLGLLVGFLGLLRIVSITFLEAMIFGAILSATDAVTVLTIFQTLKVDPKLYSIIFGESILNDAVAIVLYETLKQFHGQDLHLSNIARGIGMFFGVFTASWIIGVGSGLLCALMLKHSGLYRFPSIESCLISLIAYSSYLFSNACQTSGIVSLLFCGITLKHYAYDNMSLETKRTTKSMFHVLAQLSENFIFVYLGITLFTATDLEYHPLFILFTSVFICVSRYCSVFSLSKLLNMIAAYRGQEERLTRSHQVMLFWAGLRGAVAFALTAGLTGPHVPAIRTTILVVVVLSVIIFGGMTSRMLEILKITIGVEEDESSGDSEDDNRYERESNDELLPAHQSPSAATAADKTHWFMSFDDRFLKPIFCRSNRVNNSPSRERWRNENLRRQDAEPDNFVGTIYSSRSSVSPPNRMDSNRASVSKRENNARGSTLSVDQNVQLEDLNLDSNNPDVVRRFIDSNIESDNDDVEEQSLLDLPK